MSPLSSLAYNTPALVTVNPSVANATKSLIFTPYEHKGVIIMAAAGVTSCAFVSTLLLYIMFSALSPWPKPRPDSPTPFIRKQIAVFVICLLTSDLIQSISGIIQVKWAAEQRIYEGPVCSLQAAALVMGDLGSTVWSCVIAAHTFSGLALGKQWPRWAVVIVVLTGWTFTIVLTTIGPTTLMTESGGPFFSIAGTWCFISSEYAIARLGIHYVPLFIAAATILIIYVLVFLVLRGSISFTRHRIQASPGPRGRTIDFLTRERVIIAKRMLWYPVAYLTCILPIAIIRLMGLRQEVIPEPVWIFGMFFLFSLGAVDSVIYATTRKLIKPFNLPMPTHMRTFSDNSSTKTSFSSPRSVTSCLSDDYGRDCNDKAGYVSSPTKASFSGAATGQAGTQHEPRMGAIHVTLERIQEVM